MTEPIATPQPKDTLLARRLKHLYATTIPGNGKKECSDQVVADAVNAMAGERLTGRTHLYQLRTGRSDNPTCKLILALSRFFGVSPGYLFPDEDTARGEFSAEVEAALRAEDVQNMVLKAATLSEPMRETILRMIVIAQKIEGKN